MIDRGKRSKTLSEVKPVESCTHMHGLAVYVKVLLSHKLRDHAYEYKNPFKIKEDNLSQRNCQNQLSHLGLSHTEQECQESLIQGKIHNQQNSIKGLEYL